MRLADMHIHTTFSPARIMTEVVILCERNTVVPDLRAPSINSGRSLSFS